jgi:hypothetical protein
VAAVLRESQIVIAQLTFYITCLQKIKIKKSTKCLSYSYIFIYFSANIRPSGDSSRLNHVPRHSCRFAKQTAYFTAASTQRGSNHPHHIPTKYSTHSSSAYFTTSASSKTMRETRRATAKGNNPDSNQKALRQQPSS